MATPDPLTDAQKTRIRAKLATGALPRTLEVVSPIESAHEVPIIPGWSSRIAPCEACDEVGSTRLIGHLFWHEACFLFWRAETAEPQ